MLRSGGNQRGTKPDTEHGTRGASTPSGEQVFQPYLLRGERIVWSGQPDPSILFTTADLFLVPFSLLWGGFALVWEGIALVGALHGAGQGQRAIVFLFPLFGLPFVVIGLYLIGGRFVWKRLDKRHTYYAVTDRRVLALRTLGRRWLHAMDLAALASVDLSLRRDGTGTLSFGQRRPGAAWFENTGWLMGREGDGVAFYDIPNARDIYALVDTLKPQRGPSAEFG